jgi:enoyl-CoA hydratase/carnithine racemase
MAVDVTQHGTTRVVRINRPERRNALDTETMEALGVAFETAEHDDGVRVVLLTGEGNQAFCAGMDLRETPEERERPRRGPGLAVVQTRVYPKPLVVAVNGAAVGGGFELVMTADLVVAADHATFAVPEVKRGLVGAGCSTRLAARVPPAIAAQLTLTGDPVSAARAWELGLVNEVVPAAELLDRSLALADRVAANAPLALRVTKELLAREQRQHDAAEWAEIRRLAGPVFASADAAEGRAAFAEKRTPVWQGR